MSKQEKQYKTPQLDRFGTMSELSASGSAGAAEPNGNAPGAPGMLSMRA